MTVIDTAVSKQASALRFACQSYCLPWSDIEEEMVSKMKTVCVLCEVETEFQYGFEMNWAHEKLN